MRSAPLLLAGVLLSVAACASPQQAPPASGTAAPVCPDTLPPHPMAGPASPMVPGDPAVAVACNYGGSGSARLAKSVKVADAKALAVALNSSDTAPPPRGTMCPMDQGLTDLVIFAYPKGDPVYVTVKPGGCATATNGTAKAYRLTSTVLDKL
ncbi:hypothetical protein [Kutzneria buriramensis]|uniref:Subtilisin inhibitor-like n=1 Tax=Kutzneria buriramensis TaxID=1045776 RepID=A0A3E0HKZ8_9PSEU|nr:hypothetical protein [Kutzneria buriramensis]REH47154.1 hypothetical protein BCF44_106319 [Kutzneria buriramensis]